MYATSCTVIHTNRTLKYAGTSNTFLYKKLIHQEGLDYDGFFHNIRDMPANRKKGINTSRSPRLHPTLRKLKEKL